MKTTLDQGYNLFFLWFLTIWENMRQFSKIGKKMMKLVLLPPGQPVFWVSQLFAKLEMQLKKFDLTFFFQIFLHRHLG